MEHVDRTLKTKAKENIGDEHYVETYRRRRKHITASVWFLKRFCSVFTAITQLSKAQAVILTGKIIIIITITHGV